MGYRGEDLDLRTPQGWSGAQGPDYTGAPFGEVFFNGPRGRAASPMPAPSGPIWVDDTLLACCNHAFDVALAHRSAEVRLEHLVYALTRIEAAAEALEARGIRVPVLRRESATVIASEIPVGLAPGKAAPRRADELEEVLRLAAGNAYRRNAPASVADILHVILDGPQELSGLALLRPALQRLAAAVPEPSPPRALVAPRSDPGPGAPNGSFSTRLDALEQTVRALSSDLSIEQKTLMGVLQNLQREIMAQRDDPGRLGGSHPDKVLSERLHHLEQSMMTPRTASGSDTSFLADRLGALERALQTELGHIRLGLETLHAKGDAAVDLTPVARRIDALEQRLDADRANAKSANAALMEEIGAVKSGLASAERLEHVAAAVNTLQADMARLLSGLGERLASLEEALAGHSRRFEEAQGSYTQELGVLHEALVKLNANQHTLAGTIEARGQEATRSFAAVGMRLDGVELVAAKPIAMLELLSATMDKMHRVTVEKYYRRNRFWYWLFGTDDWVAASWPSQSARITEELRQIQTTLKS